MSSGRNHTVGVVPEPGFPEKPSQVGDIFLPHPPGRNGLQVANHSRQVHRRVTFYQQVNVVRFATELNEPTALAVGVRPWHVVLRVRWVGSGQAGQEKRVPGHVQQRPALQRRLERGTKHCGTGLGNIAGSEAAQRGIRGCPQGKPWACRQKFRASDENTVGARGYLGACPGVRRAYCDRDWGAIGCPDYSA